MLKHLPQSLLTDLEDMQSFNRQDFIAAHELGAVTSVRINPAKDISLFTANERIPWCGNGVY